MRITLPLLVLFFASCANTKSAKERNERLDYEIAHFDLEDVDTLADIACGTAYYDRIISHKYPRLHFVLEDLPKDHWDTDLTAYLTKNIQNTPYAPTFGSNSTIVFGTPDSIPLQDGQYERVLCRISLHEFTNRKKMAAELTRILSETGTLLIVEKVSSYEGQRDKQCKELYLTKAAILETFSHLTLVDTIPLLPLSDRGILFKFKKKNS